MSSRRFVGGIFRLALIVLAVFVVSRRLGFGRASRSNSPVRVQTTAPPPTDSLGRGDLRIYDADSSVDLVLMGDKVLAGLSPKTIATVKGALDSSAAKDTMGLGGSIGQIVKKSVAGAIGTHATFPVADIRNIRYEHDQIVFEWADGTSHRFFNSEVKVNGTKASKTFRPEDAQRFIEAVKARQAELPAAPR
jgi:hypothetical protein